MQIADWTFDIRLFDIRLSAIDSDDDRFEDEDEHEHDLNPEP
jgi:hypothetical protein